MREDERILGDVAVLYEIRAGNFEPASELDTSAVFPLDAFCHKKELYENSVQLHIIHIAE